MELSFSDHKDVKLTVKDEVFSCPYNGPLIHQVVTAFLSAAVLVIMHRKTRSEVRGVGAKPFRQGDGRARAGTIRSPIWRKGGWVVFAAKPRSYAQKVNRKMYRGALRSVFSELIRQERLVVLEKFEVNTCKTRDFSQSIKSFVTEGESLLILTDAVDQNLYLASRNLQGVDVRDVSAIDPVSLVGAGKVVVTAPALKQIGGDLGMKQISLMNIFISAQFLKKQ